MNKEDLMTRLYYYSAVLGVTLHELVLSGVAGVGVTAALHIFLLHLIVFRGSKCLIDYRSYHAVCR
jgi:hypothetical protein